MSDHNVYELLYLARCADEEALRLLIEQFKPLFYKTYKQLKDYYQWVDYDDAYEAMIMGLYSAVTHYREDKNTAFSSFATLCITREMRNFVKKMCNKNQGFKAVPLDSYLKDVENLKLSDMVLKDEYNDPESLLNSKFLLENIDRVLKDDNDRSILHLRMEGYSYLEIASRLGISKKDVDNSLQRIRKKIAYLFD